MSGSKIVMKINFLDKYGWPVITIKGRIILNFLRRVIHTRKICFGDVPNIVAYKKNRMVDNGDVESRDEGVDNG